MIDDYRKLTGPQKAAIAILSLGEDHAKKIFEHMDEDEVKSISITMATLGSISSNVVERILVELTGQISSVGTIRGSYETTEKMLLKSLPKEKVASIMEDIRGPAGRTIWEKLGNVNESVFANYLKNEYPQTVSVVLSKMSSDKSAKILSLLPESFSMEVIMRMLRMEPVQKEVLEDVERVLKTEFMTTLSKHSRKDTHQMLTEILNNMDRNNNQRFISGLEERNRDAAERIKSLMFTFDDLIKLRPEDIQLILRNVDKTTLVKALKGSTQIIKDLFFTNMSERASKYLKEDLASSGPIKSSDCSDAQTFILNFIKNSKDINLNFTQNEEMIF